MSKADNQNHSIIQFLTKEDQEKFDSWTKEQIYEAYLLQVKANKQIIKERNNLRRKLAEVRYIAKD